MIQLEKNINKQTDHTLKFKSCDEEKLENLALHIFEIQSINDVYKLLSYKMFMIRLWIISIVFLQQYFHRNFILFK